MIRLHHVAKVFGAGPAGEVPALCDVSFSVAKGDFVVLSGPSGAGKTTLLRLLYREELPDRGRDRGRGRSTCRVSGAAEVPALRRSIGIVFQDAKLLAGRTVFENIAFVLRVIGTPGSDITPRAFAALKAVGLSARAQAYPDAALPGRGPAGRRWRGRSSKQPGSCSPTSPPATSTTTMADGDPRRDQGHLAPAAPRCCWPRIRPGLAAHLKRRTLTLDGGRLVKDEG